MAPLIVLSSLPQLPFCRYYAMQATLVSTTGVHAGHGLFLLELCYRSVLPTQIWFVLQCQPLRGGTVPLEMASSHSRPSSQQQGGGNPACQWSALVLLLLCRSNLTVRFPIKLHILAHGCCAVIIFGTNAYRCR